MKSRKIMIIALTMMLFALCCGCRKNTTIVLSFDKDEAYFSSKGQLYPIKGDALADGDKFEKATIVIRSDSAVKMKLSVQFGDEDMSADGIKIIVDEGQAMDFKNGMSLYESEASETEATITIKIYLAKNASEVLKGKTIKFCFALDYSE